MAVKKQKKRPTVSPASPGASIAKKSEQGGSERGIDDMFSECRQSFDDLMRPFFPLTEIDQELRLPTRYAKIDLIDNGDSFDINAEPLGFTKEQVDGQIDKDGLAIHAECSQAKEDTQNLPAPRTSVLNTTKAHHAPKKLKSSKVEG